jgi:hypothetical protein
MYFDSSISLLANFNKLEQATDFTVDYLNGVVYLAVEPDESINLGEATYKKTLIDTLYKHILRVNDVYRSSSVSLPNTKSFSVSVVNDETVDLTDWETAGEDCVVSSGGIETLVDVFKLNKVFQITDLKNSFNPIDFSIGAIVSSAEPNVIVLNSGGVEISDTYLELKVDGTRLYVDAERLGDLATAGLAELVSVVNITDFYTGEDYFSQGTDGYIDNVNNRLYLPTGIGVAGIFVDTKYKGRLRDGANVVVDYISGYMYIDYTYIQDEILVSYEYGDNVLDWSISNTLSEGDTYYVSYKYGALRNSLVDNFGILTSIDALTNIPEELERETYRNALDAKCKLFSSNIDAAIRIQGKAESAKALPDVLRVSLEAIRTSGALRSSLGGLKDSETVVKMLMGEAVASSNELTAEAQAIQVEAIKFQEHLKDLRTLKDSVDGVVNTFAKV